MHVATRPQGPHLDPSENQCYKGDPILEQKFTSGFPIPSPEETSLRRS
jgi:hypothetical protein